MMCHVVKNVFRFRQANVMICSNLIIQVVITLVHLLQSEAPLILHMDMRVEFPLCSLNKLHTHAQMFGLCMHYLKRLSSTINQNTINKSE